MIENGTTQAKPDGVAMARSIDGLPLAALAAGMLAAATAFFCYAMPQRVLETILGGIGIAAPVGGVGRTIFLLVCTALAASVGWFAVTVAGRSVAVPSPGSAAATDDAALDQGTIYPPGTIEGAPPPLPVRRSDGHPDAPPRRPIFADPDLAEPGAVTAPVEVARPVAASAVLPPAVEPASPAGPIAVEAEEAASVDPVMELSEPAPEPMAEIGGPQSDQVPPAESLPAEVTAESVAPPAAPVPAPATEPEGQSIASLMDRFERGLDCHGGALPPPPSAEQIAALHDAPPGDDALRTAIEALSRIANRPR